MKLQNLIHHYSADFVQILWKLSSISEGEQNLQLSKSTTRFDFYSGKLQWATDYPILKQILEHHIFLSVGDRLIKKI